MHVLNTGNEPTFQNARRTAIIDITLTNINHLDLISDWKVSSELSGSDHFIIEFKGSVHWMGLNLGPSRIRIFFYTIGISTKNKKEVLN